MSSKKEDNKSTKKTEKKTEKKTVKKAAPKTTATISKLAGVVFPDNHLVSKNVGSDMILRLNAAISNKALPFELPLAINFNRNIFELILRDENCKGIRMYYGLNEFDQLSLIFTGIDDSMNDIYLPIVLEGETTSRKMGVGDMGQVCPLYPSDVVQLP
jgi:hypothetical protein